MKRKGQSLLEYAILLSIVLAAFSSMGMYIQRAAQANLRLIEDKAFAKEEYKSPDVSWREGFLDWYEALWLLFI